MTSACQYFSEDEAPSCFGAITKKFRTFESFLKQQSIGSRQDLLPIYQQCMTRRRGELLITSGCIGCLHCVMGCPGRSGIISCSPKASGSGLRAIQIRVKAGCGTQQSVHDLEGIWRDIQPFSGNIVKLVGLDAQLGNYEVQDFDSFLKVDETKRIAVWTAAMLQAIHGYQSTCGLEIPIPVDGKPRPGRVDVSIKAGPTVYAIETKTDFDDTMKDLRLFEQIPNYQTHLDSLSSKLEVPRIKQVVVIGGDETALLPQGDPLCTSGQGGRAQVFYSQLESINSPLVSAQAILLIALRSLIDKSTWRVLRDLLHDESLLALLTSGAVWRDGNSRRVVPLSALAKI
jgi:ferredoxin